MYRGGETVQAAEKRGGRRVEIFVANAVDAAASYGRYVFPVAAAGDLFQRNAVAGSAPGGNDDIRIGRSDLLERNLRAGSSNEFTSSGFDQLFDPELRGNQRLAPFFAESSRLWQICRALADRFDLFLHIANQFVAFAGRVHNSSNDGDIRINIGEFFRRQRQERRIRLQNLNYRFLLIRDRSNHEI